MNDALKPRRDFDAAQGISGEAAGISSDPALSDPSEGITKLDPRNFAATIHRASEAVETLADRLNAVVLRAALLDAARSDRARAAALDSYLARLAALIDSTAQQMRLIQKLLAVIEADASRSPRDPHAGRG